MGGRQVETGGLEFLLQGAVDEEGERRDEDVCLHALVGLVEDRAELDDIFEVGERALDFAELLAEADRIECGQIRLFGLNDVRALVYLLAPEVDGMPKEAKVAVLQLPGVVAVAVVRWRRRSAAAPIFSGALSRPLRIRYSSASRSVRTRCMALRRCVRS